MIQHFRVSFVLFLISTILVGCASKEMWYQQGKGQVDYDRNAQECAIIASNFARQATITGNYEDPGAYQQTFRNCLVAKGWSGSPPGDHSAHSEEENNGAFTEPLIAVDGNNLHVFGSTIKIPPSFVTSHTSTQGFGPTRAQTVMFSGPQSTFITIVAQKIDGKANRFVAIPYLVAPPFFLYEQGVVGGGKTIGRQRAVFCGVINGEWVMGLGCYVLISSRERITLIVTKSLSASLDKPEAGFRLSREQFAMVDVFEKEWSSWLVNEVTTPKKFWLFRFLTPQ